MAIHARLITPPGVTADDVPQIEQTCDCGASIVAASTDEKLERFIGLHAHHAAAS